MSDAPKSGSSSEASAKPKVKARSTLTENPEYGWKKAQSTALFRAVNPELFVRPVSSFYLKPLF